MSKFAILLIAALLAGRSALAQDSSQPAPSAPGTKHNHQQGDSADKRLKRMSKRLNLTEEQQEKMRPILQDEEQQMKSIEDGTSLTAQQKHQKERQIRRAAKTQMDAILTPEQREKIPGKRAGTGGRHHANPGQATPPSSDQSPPQ